MTFGGPIRCVSPERRQFILEVKALQKRIDRERVSPPGKPESLLSRP